MRILIWFGIAIDRIVRRLSPLCECRCWRFEHANGTCLGCLRCTGYTKLILLCLVLALPVSAQSVSVDIDMTPLLARLMRKQAGKVTCGIDTVGYRFIGDPAREFVYAGETFSIEEDGATEIIADARRKTYAVDGRSIRIDGERDQFGFRETRVPVGALPKVKARR